MMEAYASFIKMSESGDMLYVTCPAGLLHMLLVPRKHPTTTLQWCFFKNAGVNPSVKIDHI